MSRSQFHSFFIFVFFFFFTFSNSKRNDTHDELIVSHNRLVMKLDSPISNYSCKIVLRVLSSFFYWQFHILSIIHALLSIFRKICVIFLNEWNICPLSFSTRTQKRMLYYICLYILYIYFLMYSLSFIFWIIQLKN